MRRCQLLAIALGLSLCWGIISSSDAAKAASAEEIDRNVKSALEKLCAQSDSAVALREKAIGILVFPNIVKGGFMVGGKYGEGALLQGGQTAGYYNAIQVSYGLQVGLQKYGYALFFMSESAMKWLDKSDGWELGVGPTITIIDIGAAKSLSTTTGQADIYAFFFDQKGLMGGLGLQGTKITKIKK